mgnify:CR=1 FL=1
MAARFVEEAPTAAKGAGTKKGIRKRRAGSRPGIIETWKEAEGAEPRITRITRNSHEFVEIRVIRVIRGSATFEAEYRHDYD